jgi:hypothetical protein
MSNLIDCQRHSRSFECDDHLCHRDQFSCGDGLCVARVIRVPFQQTNPLGGLCVTLRECLYQCELCRYYPMWTSKSGRCLTFTHYNVILNESVDFDNWSHEDKCSWLIKCAFLSVQPPWCPCFGNSCSTNITRTCRQSLIIYPIGRLLNTLTYVAYAHNRTNWLNTTPEVFFLSGTLKCRGFHVTFKKDEIGPLSMTNEYIQAFQYDSYWCNFNVQLQHRNTTSLAPHYNLNCHRDAHTFSGIPYTFDDVCEISRECISNHRLLDRSTDCYDSLDEKMSNKITPACLSSKHRFRCSTDQPTCYLVKELIGDKSVCDNNHDIYLYGTGTLLSALRCTVGDPTACIVLRAYIQNHETTIPLRSAIPYNYHCDTFWDTNSKIDESSINCRQWVCSSNEYQCLTGQCIDATWICNGMWDCPDGSDEHGIFAHTHFSHHNQRLLNLTFLLTKCSIRYPEHQQPFHRICNRSIEYPCLLANVLDPTDIQTNRPCIPLSKIGDNVIDCYGRLDERNIYTTCSDNKSMQNFEFSCLNSQVQECIPYDYLCKKRCNGDEPLCFFRRGVSNRSCSGEKDFLCLDGKCIANARCNQLAECIHGEDEYWCDYHLPLNRVKYRALSELLRSLVSRPISPLPVSRQLQFKTINDQVAFACNRGIAIRKSETFVCLCPPSYYGLNCEFYSDRLTFIIQLNQIRTTTICFVALLLFDDQVMDEFDFLIQPLEISQKHRFHLIYSRSDFHLKHKRNRYFSRDHIIHFHPYTIRFEIYELKQNESVQLEAVWTYPIYFDFLPSFRFSKILQFETKNNGCLSNPCSIKSSCYPILNTKTSFICQCKSGFYGENCEHMSHICISTCALNAICKPTYRGIINGNDHPLCICPINRFGPTCHLKAEYCQLQPCRNNGTCLNRYDRIGIKSYECQCINSFYGDHCQYEKRLTEIHLFNVTYKPMKYIIQYYDLYSPTYRLDARFQQVYSSLPISFQFYNEKVQQLSLVLLKMYETYDGEPLYFILSIQRNVTSIDKTSSLENHCPNANKFTLINFGKNTKLDFDSIFTAIEILRIM